MGIFKDLGFKNRNDKISAPSAERFAGYTLEEVKAQINPTFVQIDGSIDGQAIIDSASLPTTIVQDTDWSSIQPVAYEFRNNDADIGPYIKTIYSNQPAAGDRFGTSCAIGSTFMLIGSHYDADKGVGAGKVEMFDLNGTYIKTIYSSQPAANDYFGISCAIGSTFMLIGSYGDDDKGTDAGKVEMFAINTTQTIFEKYISNSNTLSIKNEGLIDSLEINFFEEV